MKQNIIMAVLTKANLHSVDIYRLIKKTNNVKEGQREKLTQLFLSFYSVITTIKFSLKKQLFTTNAVFFKLLATHFEQIKPFHTLIIKI